MSTCDVTAMLHASSPPNPHPFLSFMYSLLHEVTKAFFYLSCLNATRTFARIVSVNLVIKRRRGLAHPMNFVTAVTTCRFAVVSESKVQKG